jgi:hypothetical protein
VKTNIGIETTDEEREQIATAVGSPNKLISRNEIKELVNGFVQSLIRGEVPLQTLGEGVEEGDPDDPGCENPGRDRAIRKFVPSRGDEPYLYRPEDPELAVRCSAILDGLEYIEKYTWGALERNRQ